MRGTLTPSNSNFIIFHKKKLSSSDTLKHATPAHYLHAPSVTCICCLSTGMQGAQILKEVMGSHLVLYIIMSDDLLIVGALLFIFFVFFTVLFEDGYL